MMAATAAPAAAAEAKPMRRAAWVQQALRAGDDAQQVVALAVEVFAAEPHDLAGDQHHLDAEHVVGGQPVLQAVHAARVLGDVAADRTGDLARRIGCIVEAAFGDGIGNGQIGDPRLGRHAAVVIVDLEDTVELAEAEQDAVGQRQRAPG